MELVVLRPEDQDAILNFERTRLESTHSDPMERELSSWKARWRPEQLNHYLGLGWSFGAWENGQLIGYLLAQPFLFVRGLTQTLWVEVISCDNLDTGEALLDCAYKWAKDKHFQTVLISGLPEGLNTSRNAEWMKDQILEINSSRLV